MSHEVETMFYSGATPWHGLGTRVDRALTSAEAIQQAGQDWNVRKGFVWAGPDREWQENKVCIYRETDNAILGFATPAYELFQNSQAFDFLDSLLQDGVMRYHTAGSLFGGKVVWILAQMEEGMLIAGDKYEQYILLFTSHDGKGSVRVRPTSVRVVCNNTLNWALSTQAAVEIKLSHRSGLAQRLVDASKVMDVTTEAQRNLSYWLETMSYTPFSNEQFKDLTETMFGSIDDDTHKRRVNAADQFINVWKQETSYAPEQSAYAAIQTVTGYADHHRTYNGAPAVKLDRRFQSVMMKDSNSFKQRGLAAIHDLVTA